MPRNKSYTQNWGDRVAKKSFKNLHFFFQFFFLQINFLSTWEALIRFIWISDVKVMDNLVFWAI